MILNHEQEAALARVREANKALKAAKVEANEVAKRARRDYIARHQAVNDKAAAEAHLVYGVPFSRIAEDGMGTSTHRTAKNAVEAGASLVAIPDAAEEAPEQRDEQQTEKFQATAPSTALVTLQPDDFIPFEHGLPDGLPTEAMDWSFHLDGDRLMPASADDDATWMHPVVKVVMHTAMKADVLDFIEGQGRG